MPYTQTYKNISLLMLIKISTDFCLLDEEEYLEIL